MGPAGPADRDQRGPRQGPGTAGPLITLAPVGPVDDGTQRLDRHPERLQRLDPAHEQQQRGVGGEAQRPAGLAVVPGGEEGVVHARGHDLDALRVGLVQLNQLVRLHGARGQHRVRATNDLGLGVGPAGRLGRVELLGASFRLHPVEGVERRDQWHVQLVLQDMARQARQPVVGMNGVGLDPVGRQPPQALPDPGGELLDHRGQQLLGHGGERPRGHMMDPETGLHRHRRRLAGIPRPGEHLAGHPGTGQGRGQLAHVHVHAASVAGARLGQRRGVQGKNSQAAHGRERPYPDRPDI